MKILVLDERAEEYRTHLNQITHPIEYAQQPEVTLECDVLLASPAMAAGYVKSGRRPKWIQSTWAGVDSLVPILSDKSLIDKSHDGTGIVLTGIKGIFGQLMSEYVFAYLLADLRDLDLYNRQQQNSKWDDSKLPGTLKGRTITIVGTGSIGEHLASTARHFGMHTTGVNRSGSSNEQFDRVTQDLANAVSHTDYVVACLPDTKQTNRVFDTELFQHMAKQALFINVGRGNSVDEVALLSALDSGQLRGAILDVFAQEPLPEQNPIWQHERIAVTPHISAPSFTDDIAMIFIENLTRFEKGEPLLNRVDFEKGY